MISTLEINFDNAFLNVAITRDSNVISKSDYTKYIQEFMQKNDLNQYFAATINPSVWPGSNYHTITLIKNIQVDENTFITNISKFNRLLRAIVFAPEEHTSSLRV